MLFGFDRYALSESLPVRAWRCKCCDNVYKAKTARDALDAARSDYPWRILRSEDLSEINMADLVASENAQARAQDPSLTRAEGAR